MISVGHQIVTKNCIYWSWEKISNTKVVQVWWFLRTHRDHSEFHFIRNVQLALFQNLAEMEEHPGITVHTFDKAKTITHGSYHTLHKKTSRETKPTLTKNKSIARKKSKTKFCSCTISRVSLVKWKVSGRMSIFVALSSLSRRSVDILNWTWSPSSRVTLDLVSFSPNSSSLSVKLILALIRPGSGSFWVRQMESYSI